MVDELECPKCFHRWYPRYKKKLNIPDKCPKCKYTGPFSKVNLFNRKYYIEYKSFENKKNIKGNMDLFGKKLNLDNTLDILALIRILKKKGIIKETELNKELKKLKSEMKTFKKP